jgi:hypothetical protein
MQPNIIKSAMLNGLIMGVLFSINFLCSLSQITAIILLSYILMIYILVAVYRSTVKFRDVECNGVITYSKAFSYVLLTFFFASLISSIAKFVYFQFVNPNYLDTIFQESMKMLQKMKFPIDDESMKQVESMLKPASFSLQFIWINVFIGSLVGLIMAVFIKKDKSVFAENNESQNNA